jgi:DtxR family Mn-dependent transcriptional regulator/ferrous iron transport protein A
VKLGRDEHGVVVALDSDGAMRRRLMDLGLLPRTPAAVSMRSPLRDPTA